VTRRRNPGLIRTIKAENGYFEHVSGGPSGIGGIALRALYRESKPARNSLMPGSDFHVIG